MHERRGREVEPVPVLDRAGQLLALPYDATLMFAQYLAHSTLAALRRYSIGTVRRAPKDRRPRQRRPTSQGPSLYVHDDGHASLSLSLPPSL
jgi:histidyl-tRNA synthetase